ncbi:MULTISPECIES: hypothetical protein [Klebsiella]|uniref:hypothetical protein n=1 Tax=Klebsiella TaxID=570 RepID=UPI0014952218|nr:MULTISPECIES: hypothetical protein [Klebsiella]EJC6256972.1 hypothetical protein [Klebsiella aerogenes]MEC5505569.1 hypothetical protein [Klebsiella oxytoca]NPE20054.1 hypothetical protein [Klebsiella aerogenes]HBT4316360.1 hypothetical protein [Klebsiella aerogenes]HDT1163262.1 hypothetical protein [Klebsiella aerogenes]
MGSSKFKDVGSYKMDGFHLTINTDNSMEELTPEENQTLVHEYTHFLQSISTVYGWYRISNLAIITQHLVYGIYNKDNGFVRQFPFFSPSGKDGALIESAMSLNTMLEGSNGEEGDIKKINQSSGFYVVHDVKAECFSKHPDFDEDIMELPAGATLSKNIRVTYLFDPTGQRKDNPNKIDVMLGAVCIYEFMAYAIEKHVSEKNVILPQVPYFVVKDVAEFILEMEVDDKIIACLCEFALQSRSPGETFYDLLIGLKKQGFDYNVLTPDHMRKIFNACYIMETDDGPISYSSIELLHKYADETLEEYKTLFSSLEDYKSIADLLSHINDAVNVYRNGDLYMISKLLFKTPKEAISEIIEIMKTVGIPPIFNNSGYIGHSISDHRYDRYYLFLPMLNEFVNFTLKGNFRCELLDTCKKHSPEVINDKCHSNVYLKGKDDLLCGVGQIIKMWKLNDYTFLE